MDGTRTRRHLPLGAFFLAVGSSLLTHDLALCQPGPAQSAEQAEDVEPAALDEVTTEPQESFIPDLVFARMAENPVSGITRVPVANFVNFGTPPRDRVGYALVLAPVIPARFKGGWSILTRTTITAVATVPFEREASGAPDPTGRTTGFGDLGLEVLGAKQIRGKKKQFYDVSVGPFVGAPSATDDFLGRGRWLLGPAIALGISAKHWVTVLIARNEWSVGKSGSRADVNQMWMQYFLFYNLPKLFYLVYEPIITVNWEREPRDRATLPVGIGWGRHIRLPKRPRLALTTRYSGFYNALRTDQGAKWQLVATVVFWKPNPAVFGIE